ncbi:hypothetical protein AA0242T_1200 [Acetobacter aceti NRIC 0242]|nr:hypothetical protein AA0242T_1200 [Acetobacter aceti NRIC 0242]
MNLSRPPELHQKTSYRQTVMTRYFGSFIGNQSITDKTMTAYQQWRNTYWTEETGQRPHLFGISTCKARGCPYKESGQAYQNASYRLNKESP